MLAEPDEQAEKVGPHFPREIEAMNMKHTLLVAGLAIACGALAPTALAAQGGSPDGTITINGLVAANTCAVAVTGGSGNTITLPTVFSTSLSAAGNTAGNTPFSINLTGCDKNLTSVYTWWTGGNIVAGDGNLKNTLTTNNATNVEVRLLNGDSSTINLAGGQGAQNSKSATFSSQAATLNYIAQYYALAGGATAGQVSTSVSFTLVYQ